MSDPISIFNATSESLATTADVWTDYGSPQSVVGKPWAFLSGYSDVAMSLRLVQGMSASGPWHVYGDALVLGAGVAIENDSLQVRIGKPWVKLQRKCVATCIATFDVTAGV